MRYLSIVLALGICLTAAACSSATGPDGARRLGARDDTTTPPPCSGYIDINGECVK